MPEARERTPDETRYMEWINTGIMDKDGGRFDIAPIDIEELNFVIKQVKREKAPGPDDIPFDLITSLSVTLREELLAMLHEWWRAESLPDELLKSRVETRRNRGTTGPFHY